MIRFSAHLMRRLRQEQRGSIAIEFALVAPVLLLILAGVIDIGGATYTRLSLDARVTAMAEYALLQSAPGDQAGATKLAEALAGMLQGQASETGKAVVNNAATAEWTGSAVTSQSGPGDVANCYCPTLSADTMVWGQQTSCGAPCASGGSAGQFVQISAEARHVTIFPGYAFIEGDTVGTSTVLRLK